MIDLNQTSMISTGGQDTEDLVYIQSISTITVHICGTAQSRSHLVVGLFQRVIRTSGTHMYPHVNSHTSRKMNRMTYTVVLWKIIATRIHLCLTILLILRY
jgi:hypothetical protein